MPQGSAAMVQAGKTIFCSAKHVVLPVCLAVCLVIAGFKRLTVLQV